MGLFQDQTSSLSEIKRLAALVTDPSRRGEIGSDQWPLAMIAYGLVTCNETGREEEGVIIYNMFQSRCAPDARRKCALQLAAFIRQRKGDGWRALLPFAMADEAPDIRRQSAFLIYTLAAPQPEERFPGIAGLANVICASPCPGQASMTPALDALMSLGDMRFAPYLSFISKISLPGASRTCWPKRRPFPRTWAADGCWIFWMNIRNFPPPLRRYWPECPPEPEKCWTWSFPSPPGNSPIPPSSRSIPGVFPNTGCAWENGSPDILPRKRGKPWTGHGAESSGVSQPAAFFKKPSPKNAERLF